MPRNANANSKQNASRGLSSHSTPKPIPRAALAYGRQLKMLLILILSQNLFAFNQEFQTNFCIAFKNEEDKNVFEFF